MDIERFANFQHVLIQSVLKAVANHPLNAVGCDKPREVLWYLGVVGVFRERVLVESSVILAVLHESSRVCNGLGSLEQT